MVRDGSVVCPGSDAAVLRIKADSLPDLGSAAVSAASFGASPNESPAPSVVGGAPTTAREARTLPEKLIALTADGNGTYVYLDPYEGAKIVMAEACRNLACSGAVPLGTTDNLNMPSPMKPELFWQIKESVRGLAEACRAFNAPVTGGNCSLYNQSPNGPIDPTPTVVVVGLIEKPEHVTTQWFKDEGDAIILLGDAVDTNDPLLGLGGSAYLQVVHGQENRLAAAVRFGNRQDTAHHAARTDPMRPGKKRARLQRRRPGRLPGRKLHQPVGGARNTAADWRDMWIFH